MVVRILVASIVIAGLLSCATGPQSIPIQERVRVPDTLSDTLGDQGLVVATIAANAVSAGVFQQLSFSMAGVQIDNVYYSNAVRNNYLVLPLKPGEYTLNSLYVYRDSEDRTETRYPLGYKFRVVSHQATNLGLIALAPVADQEKRYLKVLVDNNADMTAYLRARYPKLAAELRPTAPVLTGDTKFADANLLEALRGDIARSAWHYTEDPNIAHYVGGEAGTIAKLLRNTQGKVAAIDVLDTRTTTAMLSCSGHDQRFVCSSAEPALYFVEDDKVEKRALPVPAKHVWVHTFAPRGLVLVDESMNVYSSTDNGATWLKYVWFQRKEPLHPFARVRFANGRNGYYVYATFAVDPLAPEVIYSEFARTAYRKVDIPKMKNWQRLIETSEGILVGPQNTDSKSDNATLYFRPSRQTEWQARPLPGPRCFGLQRENESTEALRVFCNSKFYASTDGGRTWTDSTVAKK
jgi:hypothetical protein